MTHRPIPTILLLLSFIYLVAPAPMLTSCASQHTASQNHTLMRAEADSFLRSMQPGLQRHQTQAVRQAMAGDVAPLQAVRSARNATATLPENVTACMLTPTLRLYQPARATTKPLPLLVYLHGGGWTFGSINSCARFCSAMAATGGMKVLAVDYRLAPEHPYPEGLDDCIEAVQYALTHADSLGIDPARIVVGGDSSGGNLAVATALSPRCSGRLHGLLLFYPVTLAYADGSPSWRRYADGYGLDADLMNAFNEAYTVRADARHSAISVGLASAAQLQTLPRTLLIAAGRDILRDQGLAFAERVGARLTRIEYPEAVHLFITVPGQPTAFRTAVRQAAAFITGASAPLNP